MPSQSVKLTNISDQYGQNLCSFHGQYNSKTTPPQDRSIKWRVKSKDTEVSKWDREIVFIVISKLQEEKVGN